MSRPPLLAHQRAGIEWIGSVGRGLLGDEAGLGKSRIAIEAFDGGDVLIIAPSMVITGGTWTDELAKWADHPERFVVAPYTSLGARVRTKKGGSSPTDTPRPEYDRSWDAIIVDEAHYTKNRGTHWTTIVEGLAKRSGSVLEMTGTPMPNWAHELYTILRVMRPEEAKPGGQFGSYHRWINTWFERIKNPFNKTPGAEFIGGLKACSFKCTKFPANHPCEHWQEFARENLGGQFLRRLREDVLDLPPLTEQVVHTDMSPAAAKMYRELRKDFLTNVNGQEIVAWSDGAKNVMLDKLTTSEWLLTKEGEPRGGKLDRLEHDLAERSRPTLVLAHYRDSVDAAVRVAERAGARALAVHGGVKTRDKAYAVAEFKAGRLDVLVGSLETLAEGLTLTQADKVIFMEKSFKPSRNEQALRRIHRIGQECPVTAVDYVTPKSVDENKRDVLAHKTDQQTRMLSAAEFASML